MNTPIVTSRSPNRSLPSRSVAAARIVAAMGLAMQLISVADGEVLRAQSVQRLVAKPVWSSADDDDATPSRPARLAVDAAGRVYLPEPTESALYVYSATGSFLGKIGRKGSGPGEFQNICCAGFDPKGRLWARDLGGARYVVFNVAFPAGKLQARPQFVVNMPHRDVNRWTALGFDPTGALFDIGLIHSPDSKPVSKLTRFLVDTAGVVKRSLDLLEQVDNVTAPLVVTTTTPDGVSRRLLQPPFAGIQLLASAPNGDYAQAGSAKYEIVWRNSDGAVKHTIRRAIDGPPLADAERKRAQADIANVAKSAGKRVSELPFGVPARKPPLRGLEFDPEGRLWVERFVARGALRESDVYLPNGTHAFTVVWPALPSMVFYGTARGRDAWVTTQDADDIPHIVKLALTPQR